ncbi:MAG: SRPBCC family protein [Granulosicoccus sp.]|nr:SRPBCC family protein [Granulosicoccus sp.]
MSIRVAQNINASPERIWQVITDIDNAAQNIEHIQKVEVLERPVNGVVGLKWRETRKMFGKEADEVMTIDQAEPNRFYQTRAENHGAVYQSRMEITPLEKGCELAMSFESQPVTIVARLMSLMTFLFAGSVKKMIAQDLADIKKVAEASEAA